MAAFIENQSAGAVTVQEFLAFVASCNPLSVDSEAA
jgi:hypothetical protein